MSISEQIDVMIVDWHGKLRGKRLPVSQIDKVLAGQTRLPLSTQVLNIWGEDNDELTGLALSIGDPDGLCIPALDTRAVQAWDPRLEQVLTSMHTLDGAASEFDVREVLRRQEARFAAIGLQPVVAVELEFYLLDAEAAHAGVSACASGITVPGMLGGSQLYDMKVMDRASGIVGRINQCAQAMGIAAETALAEFGPGQFEINLTHCASAVQAADQAVLFKRIVDRVAHDAGLIACFMAKPFTEESGSGQHVHVSLLDEQGMNVFDAGDKPPLRLQQAVAGLLDSLKPMQLVFAPHSNSYRRLQPENFAPVRADWGMDHRGVAVRVPETTGKAARVEHRVAGADANPYLVVAAVLGGIFQGLQQGRQPASPPLAPGGESTAESLTHDWLTAIRHFQQSTLPVEFLGERFATLYATVKAYEAHRINRQVTDVERNTYLARV